MTTDAELMNIVKNPVNTDAKLMKILAKWRTHPTNNYSELDEPVEILGEN